MQTQGLQRCNLLNQRSRDTMVVIKAVVHRILSCLPCNRRIKEIRYYVDHPKTATLQQEKKRRESNQGNLCRLAAVTHQYLPFTYYGTAPIVRTGDGPATKNGGRPLQHRFIISQI